MTPPPPTEHPLHDVLDRLGSIAGRDGHVALGDVIEAFGQASFVPALLVPALLVVSPLSGIPGFSSVMGLTIALVALQMIVGRTQVWLPAFLLRRRVKRERMRQAVDRTGAVGDWIDRRTRLRLTWVYGWPVRLLPETLCVACGAAMPFLELVPFSSSILGGAVVLFSVGFLSRDGLMALAGCGLMALATVIPAAVLIGLG